MPEGPSPSAPRGEPGPPSRGVLVVLSYLWLLALIPLAAEKADPEIRWHARHGLVLFGAEMALFVVMSILGGGLLERLLVPVVQVGIVVLHTLCIARGLKGERFQVPGLSEYADRL